MGGALRGCVDVQGDTQARRRSQSHLQRAVERSRERVRPRARRARNRPGLHCARVGLPGRGDVLLRGRQRSGGWVERLRDDLPRALREPKLALVQDAVRLGPAFARVDDVAHGILGPRRQLAALRSCANLLRRRPALRAPVLGGPGAVVAVGGDVVTVLVRDHRFGGQVRARIVARRVEQRALRAVTRERVASAHLRELRRCRQQHGHR